VLAGQNETATLFAEQATAAGVNVSVIRDDPATYYSTGSPGGTWPNKHFSINNWVIGQGSLPLFYLSALYQSAPYGETHWHNAAADQLLNEALADGNPATAQQKWHAVQQLQHDQGGYIVTTALNYVDGYSTKVRGIQTTEAGPCNYWDFKTAWLAT
jgi:peptide/nickel transport system substrate-binding protein